MTYSAYIEAVAVPQRYSPDFEVQAFCECLIWNFNPRAAQGSPRDVIDAAREHFGHRRCVGLGFTVH